MTSDAGRQGVDVSTNDDTNVSAQTDTLTREPRSKITKNAFDMEESKKDVNLDEPIMEPTLESAIETTPTAQLKSQITGSENSKTEQKCDNSYKDATEEGMKTDSNFLRPRTDSNLSRGSSEVNWEELQKTENQHVQEEGSDEVSYWLLYFDSSLLISITTGCGFSPCSVGARE